MNVCALWIITVPSKGSLDHQVRMHLFGYILKQVVNILFRGQIHVQYTKKITTFKQNLYSPM